MESDSEPEGNTSVPEPPRAGSLKRMARAASPKSFVGNNSSTGPSPASSMRHFSAANSPQPSVSPRSTSPSLLGASFQSDHGPSVADISMHESRTDPIYSDLETGFKDTLLPVNVPVLSSLSLQVKTRTSAIRLESTPSTAFPAVIVPRAGDRLIEKIRRDSDQINTLRLTKLSDAPELSNMSFPSKNGESVRALLERFYRACVDVYREGPTYSPKGFTPKDNMVGICVLRLGGARLADILHRALGLPGLTTLRKHAVIRPLRASPGVPTVQEIIENIDAYTDGEDVPVGPPQIIHRVVMLDEIAVERRARWDDKTNMILGACREHCANVPLEFGTMDDATQFFEAMDRGEVHLATEATVVAFGALSKDPQIYNPRPICISGTCKAETASEHAAFLRTVGTAAEKRRSHGNITYRTISYASDGEAKRGSAFVKEFMKYSVTLLVIKRERCSTAKILTEAGPNQGLQRG
ncbi:hypothetical protein B0H11DRAFT_2325227 [Mycena galericulata]|nr:hypothetical protein B0H11DRAFT_2325227 [Mycena galericulata]